MWTTRTCRPFARAVALAALCVLACACGGGGGGHAKNTPPTASFAASPSSGVAPLPVALDATASVDREGPIAAYAWNFGDGSAVAAGATSSHVYQSVGSFTVTLTVTDSKGATGTASRTITVTANAPPTAAFTAMPTSGLAPLTVTFDASASSDPDNTIAAYAWNFGDGSAVAAGATSSHVYQSAGSFTVTLTVTDSKGATGTASRTITVTANAPPIAAFTAAPAGGSAPLTVSFNASTSSDPDGSIVTYEWTFDDGASGTGPSTQHTYVNGGSFNVRLKVTDDRGGVGTTSRLIVVSSATAAAWYSVTEIPSLGGWYVEPSSVNKMGMATGFSYFDATDVAHAFVFNGRNSIDIGTLGGKASYGRDVNDFGDVVGNSNDPQGFSRAFLFVFGTMQDLGTLGGLTSEATGVNNAAQVVGRSDDKDGFVRAFLYENGQMRSLGTLGGDWSQASAINENGAVAGASTIANGERHAFIYSGGAMADVSGVAVDSVSGINDANDVIGMWTPPQGYPGLTGFLYRGGVMQSLVAGYSEPEAINNAGIVVGYAHFGQDGRAFIWDKTKGLQDLNSLIDPALGWTLQVAEGINDLGQIVAHGYRAGGASVAVLLTPAVKPSP